MLHGSGTEPPTSAPHPNPVGARPIHELLSQSSIWHPGTRWHFLGRVSGRLRYAQQLREQSLGEVTLVAGIAASRLVAHSWAGCAALHNHTCQSPPCHGRHLVTAPARAAALSGEGLLFWEECFHLAYIKRIHFAVTRQAQSCAGASFPSAPAAPQLGRSRSPAVLAHTHSQACCSPGHCLMQLAPVCIPPFTHLLRGCCNPPGSCSAPLYISGSNSSIKDPLLLPKTGEATKHCCKHQHTTAAWR